MTTTPSRETKIRRTAWREEDHPRDRAGKFIETGARVRIWGGRLASVLRNVGGGRIEVQRDDGRNVIVHRNYLTVISRPSGADPTDRQDDAPEALPEQQATEGATDAPTPTSPALSVDEPAERLAQALTTVDPETADVVRIASADYQAALTNGIADDEADERDGLLQVLGDVERRYGNQVDVPEAVEILRRVATALPPEAEGDADDVVQASASVQDPEAGRTPEGDAAEAVLADYDDETGRSTTWPRLRGARGQVRTTNGGVIDGLLSSQGTSYEINVLTDDMVLTSIPASRVRDVRLDTAPVPGGPDSVGDPNPDFGKRVGEPERRANGAGFDLVEQIGRREPGETIERVIARVRRDGGVWGVYPPTDQSPAMFQTPSKREAERWADRFAAGEITEDGDERTPGSDGAGALPGVPADGVRPDRGSGDVLPDAGRGGAGADRGDGGGAAGDGPRGGVVRRPDESVPSGTVDRGVGGDPGDDPAAPGAAGGDDESRGGAGRRGDGGGADGVRDSGGVVPGADDSLTARPEATVATDRLLWRAAESRDRPEEYDGPDDITARGFVGGRVRVEFYNENGVADLSRVQTGRFEFDDDDDGSIGTFRGVYDSIPDRREILWRADGADEAAEVDWDLLYSVTATTDDVDPGQGDLFDASGDLAALDALDERAGATYLRRAEVDEMLRSLRALSDADLEADDAEERVAAILNSETESTGLPEVDAIAGLLDEPQRDAVAALVVDEGRRRDEVEAAREAGRQAFDNDQPAAPGLDETVRDLVADAPVGEAHTMHVMSAFTEGYEEGRARALAEIALAEPDPAPDTYADVTPGDRIRISGRDVTVSDVSRRFNYLTVNGTADDDGQQISEQRRPEDRPEAAAVNVQRRRLLRALGAGQSGVSDTGRPVTELPPRIGTWRVVRTQDANEGLLEVDAKVGHDAKAEIRLTDRGWVGRMVYERYYRGQRLEGTVVGDDVQDVLDRMYDWVNGEGRAERMRAEADAGRSDFPEVPTSYGSLVRGDRIRVDGQDRRFIQGYPLNYNDYGAGYRIVHVALDDDPENATDGRTTDTAPGARPEPVDPRLGDEGPTPLDVEMESGETEYVPDVGAVASVVPGVNRFRPTGAGDFAQAGTMTKLDANIAALRTLAALRNEQRPATADEQAVLARWAGWGGLADVFDENKTEFASRRAEVFDLLDAGEINEAKRNTLNAHYTDAEVVKSVWNAVGDLGFDGGRVLEPGSGSGTFIGFAPDSASMVGVELDSTTAAISKHLYPDAVIRNESFAETSVPEGAFDATVGNVPFGRFSLFDPTHNPTGDSIHNHFIGKSLAFTRPGGLVAVLSSRYTLDAQDSAFRERVAEQADLVGAVRLPNGSHQRVSGTDVIEDVLIFRKRLPGEEPQADRSWLKASKKALNGWNVTVSDYFDKHPEYVLGNLTAAKGRFGGEVRVDGDRDVPGLDAALADIVAKAQATGLTATDRPADQPLPTLLQPGAGRYEGQIVEQDGAFSIARGGAEVAMTVPRGDVAELRSLIGMRDTLDGLLRAEATTGEDTDEIADLRSRLNREYDDYVARYGPINRYSYTRNGSRQRPKQGGFRDDPKSDVLAALEQYEPPTRDSEPGDVGSATKAAIFTTRAVAPRQPRTKADTPADALTLSMDTYGRVDLPAIAAMLDTDEVTARRRLGDLVFEIPPYDEQDRLAAEEAGLAARDSMADVADLEPIAPESLTRQGTLVPAAEYLSGNVRRKAAAARMAAAVDPRFATNAQALDGVTPRDLGVSEVEANLGATWIDADVVQEFVNDLMGLQSWERRTGSVVHSGGNIWRVDIPNKGSTLATEQWGTPERPFHKLVQSLLEQRPIDVTVDGKKDAEATLSAQSKAEEIQERFREWVWENPQRTRRLLTRYNDLYNSVALRAYDGSQRQFPGMSEDWQRKVQPHVKNAVERIVNEPTAMLAHVVGAGKTAEMVMGTAELKRLGLARKPAIVIPDHMLGQFTREYLEIYPSARILTAGQGMSAADRREFVARAATGDWDAVIMTQGAFEAIPMSGREVERYIDTELGEQRAQLDLMRSQDGSDKGNLGRTVKAAEAALLRAETALRKRLASQKDLGISFEQTGIDYLMVDEAHMYSNLRTITNVANAGATGSNKATDLHMKMEWLRRTSKSGRVATFATGTPIRNTVTQAYVMVRYLRPDLLKDAGIHSFDQWAATFGEVISEMELKPEGTGFRQTQRFAKFRNVPEFLRMFHTFADVKMRDDLNLPTPNVAGGKAQVVAVPRTDAQAEYIAALGDRAERVRAGAVEPTEDNMLKVSTDGRKAALSMALVGGTHEPGKIEVAADRMAAIWEANKDRVYTDPRTGEPDDLTGAFQIAFMDMGTPKGAKVKGDENTVDDNDSGFSGYDLLKSELVARGVPADQIRYVHEAKNDDQKAELFMAARMGKIAVLIGSSDKMGVGTNMQRRAKALHHIDAPWRPADVEQRDGRIERQGNLHMNLGEDIEIYRYVTEGSFDAYMWQTLERKAKFINQIMRGSLDVREIEDVGDTAMSYAEVKALALGKPDFLHKAKADAAVAKLSRLARSHARSQSMLDFESRRLSAQSQTLEQNAAMFTVMMGRTEVPERFTMDVRGETIQAAEDGTSSGRSESGNALREAMLSVRSDVTYGTGPMVPIANYNGHQIVAQSRLRPDGERIVALSIDDSGYEFTTFGLDDLGPGSDSAARGIVQRVDRFIESIPERATSTLDRALSNRAEVERMRERIGLDYARQDELDAWKRRAERLGVKIQWDEQRAEGAEIPYNAAIDTDRDDDPRTVDRDGAADPGVESLGSAETFVPVEIPAEQTVVARDLGPDDQVGFMSEEREIRGQVVSVRVAAGLVFLTILLPGGSTVTRALRPDEDVTRYADPAAVGGVKHLVIRRTLTFKAGRVVVEVKAFARPNFDETEHPRDRMGRFIETGAEVRIWGGSTGRVTGIAPGGRLKVERDRDGVTVNVDAGNVTVVDAPEVAQPDAPEDVQAPEVPNSPDVDVVEPVVDAPQAGESGDAADLATYATSPATDVPETPYFRATNASGAEAMLSNEDGTIRAFVRDSPDGQWQEFDDPQEWGTYVNAAGFSEQQGDLGPEAMSPERITPETPEAPAAPAMPQSGAAEVAPETESATAGVDASGRRDIEQMSDDDIAQALTAAPTPDQVEPLRRVLTERAAEKADAILAAVAPVEPEVTKALTDTAEQFGGGMEGLKNRVKEKESLTRKIRDKALTKGITQDQSAAGINDALRYTMTLDADNYTEGVRAALAEFERLGYTQTAADNTWGQGQVYQGINSTFTTPDGVQFEVQFHTPESFAAKSQTHADYNIARDLTVPLAERQEAHDRMVALQESNPMPPNVDSVGFLKAGAARPSDPNVEPTFEEQALKSRSGIVNDLKNLRNSLDAIDLESAKDTSVPTLAEGAVLPDGVVADLQMGGSGLDNIVQNADGTWSWSPERTELHRRIVASILDEYEGGEDAPSFNVMGGGPAAGKSTMEAALPEISEGKAVLNADLIKEMLPEFLPGVEASDEGVASLVHEESSYLAKVVKAEAFSRRISVTLDGTGDSGAAKMQRQIQEARDLGYQVNGFYVTAESDEAVRRANARAAKTGRAVPESVIRGTHRTVSAIFPEIADDFDTVVLYDTQAPGVDGAPALIGRKDAGGTFEVSDQGLYDKFVAKADEPDTPKRADSDWTPYVDDGDTGGATTAADAQTGVSALAAPQGPPRPGSFTREDGAAYDGDPVDDDVAYLQHAAFITEAMNQALGAGMATDRQHTVDGDGTTWTAERTALHREILDEIYEGARGVPNDGQAFMAGGLGGAGKGTILRDQAGIDRSQFLTVNPDDIKEIMAARDLIPEVDGLSPMEANALIHEEASYLGKRLAARATADRKNLIWDITMSSEGSVQQRVDALRDAGYAVSAVFVDIPVETSVERALSRHRNGMARHRNGEGFGGRFVLPSIIREGEDEQFSSKNRAVFEGLKPQFDGFRVYDNGRWGEQASLVDEGGSFPLAERNAAAAASAAPDAQAPTERDPASMTTAEIEAAIAGGATGGYLARLRRTLRERQAEGDPQVPEDGAE